MRGRAPHLLCVREVGVHALLLLLLLLEPRRVMAAAEDGSLDRAHRVMMIGSTSSTTTIRTRSVVVSVGIARHHRRTNRPSTSTPSIIHAVNSAAVRTQPAANTAGGHTRRVLHIQAVVVIPILLHTASKRPRLLRTTLLPRTLP